MQEPIQDTLTRPQLVVELQKLGYKVTERRIIDWQEKDLLPPFDVIGVGLGRRGRKRSSWLEGERIIEQAIWVYKLLKDLVREPMQTHNQQYAHTLLRLFIFVQKTALRFFNNYFVCSLVHHLQTQLSRPARYDG